MSVHRVSYIKREGKRERESILIRYTDYFRKRICLEVNVMFGKVSIPEPGSAVLSNDVRRSSLCRSENSSGCLE